MVGDLEKLVWRNTLAILEKTCLAIWRKSVQRLGENVFGDLEKTCSTIWRKRVRRFGENVFGDLEKLVRRKGGRRSFGDFVLEFVME